MKIILDTDLEEKIRKLVSLGMTYIEALVSIANERGFSNIDIAHWIKKHPAIMSQLEREGIEEGTLKQEDPIRF